jgi:hypothetical protein
MRRRGIARLIFANVVVTVVIVGCGSGSDNSTGLSPQAERLARYVFTDQGASKKETACGVQTLTARLGSDELNRVANAQASGDRGALNSHRTDIIAVSEQCGVEDHTLLQCGNPRSAHENAECRHLERVKRELLR